ncbi:(d)CMP kinase [Marinospirillum alkaliphilum]|uniref:Cytidylate kinase n=1 Tax=Marinospirillum alkaliphilum DSM 21637 TaxID=1122209 RepID=A0A1K1UFI5_9GAMM|nr:(d)CMP kinase [Marinospirillum alkaliphilum]SFX11554.1 cytidylate kinase [Marinospirillum alkaliphilum DSM 21637]
MSSLDNKVPVITLDGPGGAGKGTVSMLLARELGWHLLDSGALYRLVGLAAEHHGVALDNEAALGVLAEHLDVQFLTAREDLVQVVLEGEDVSHELRTERVGGLASQVAALPAVRQALLARQRAFREFPGLICDGRDMGTVVFPEAPLKIYLTASADERARRRLEQLRAKGVAASLLDLKNDILERDARDMNRTTAPLRPADDAVEVDTTSLNIPDVVDLILAEAKSRGLISQASSA